MKRFQIYLEDSQVKKLETLSERLSVSKADIIREGIDLVVIQKSAEIKDPLLNLIGICDKKEGPKDSALRHDKYLYGKKSRK